MDKKGNNNPTKDLSQYGIISACSKEIKLMKHSKGANFFLYVTPVHMGIYLKLYFKQISSNPTSSKSLSKKINPISNDSFFWL